MRLLLLFLGLAVVFLIPFLIWGSGMEAFFSGEGAADWLRNYGEWAWLAGIVLLALDLFLPLPGTVIMSALGFVYGPFVGGAIAAVGSILAALLAYGLCRALGDRAAQRLVGQADLDRGRDFFTKAGGFWSVALSRWLPLLPEAVSCLAGLVRMPLSKFLAGVLAGSIPMAFVFAAIGHGGHQLPWLALAASALLPPLLWWVAGRRLFRS